MADRFHVLLKDPKSEQRRMVTLSRVPCPKCENDPFRRGAFETPSGYKVPACKKCGGSGDVPATKDSAAAFLESMEQEYAAFRLDDPATIARYDTLDGDSLARVMETTAYVAKDTVLIDGRFVRAGKILREAHPGYTKQHKGWRSFHEQEEPYKVHQIGRLSHEMAVTGGQYGVPLKNLYTGANLWDWDTDTIKTALTTSSYTVDIDTHDFFNDVTNELSTAGNYTAGGWTLASAASSYDTATDQVRLDAADVTQASATFTARRAPTYKNTGTASTSPLITFLDFGADVSPSAGTFTITWDATGIFVHDIT